MGCDVRFCRLSTLQRNLSTTLHGVTFFQTESPCRPETEYSLVCSIVSQEIEGNSKCKNTKQCIMLLNNYLTSFLCRLYPVASCWLNLTATLPSTCMLTTHNAPYLSNSVTTTEPHGRLVMPLSPPPGRPWPSFLKNALGAMGYLVLPTQAALKVYFPHTLHAAQRRSLSM
jgi:hypothetical protein